MSGGGKGGSSTVAAEIPKWVEGPATRNLERAETAQKVGYTPWYGPDVAAFTPPQQQAMQSTYDAAAAFGLAPQGQNVAARMPPAQNFNGIMGYSSSPLYEQAVAEARKKDPAAMAQYDKLFV